MDEQDLYYIKYYENIKETDLNIRNKIFIDYFYQFGNKNFNKSILQYIKNPTKRFYNLAIKNDIFALKYIDNPSEKICCKALMKKGNKAPIILSLIKNQTSKICKKAIKESIKSLKNVIDQTHNICSYAIRICPHSIIYVRTQTLRLCFEAVNLDVSTLQHIHNQTEDLCKYALKKDINAIKYIEDVKKYIKIFDFV